MNTLFSRCPAATFGNVGRHRYSRSAYLVAKRIFLGVWKFIKVSVNLTHEDTGLLPNIKFFKYKLFHNISFVQRYKKTFIFNFLTLSFRQFSSLVPLNSSLL